VLDPAVLALAAAASFAGSGIFLRRAIATVTPPSAALVSVTFTATFVWIVTAATVPLSRLAAHEVLFFLAAGLSAPGLARLLYYVGLARVGVARSAALTSVAPLFAVGLAIAVLGERPTALAIAGVAAVVAGGALLARRARDDRSWRRRDLVLPLLAALGFAIRDIVSRHGLATYPEPMIAAAAATFASVVLMWALAMARIVPVARPPAVGLGWLALSGLCECLAYLTMWRALAAAPVSIVSPLVHAQPLFTIVLAAIFLRDVERMTWRIVAASLLIVAGVTFVLRFT
jgi:drug/metabolite transporter (DMT)-like permease